MRLAKIAAFTLALVVVAAPAGAQQDRPGRDRGDRARQQLEPERAKAAWAWQAKSVGREMGLDDALTEQLVTAYVKSRQELADAARKARAEAREKARAGEGGKGGQGGQAGQAGEAGDRGAGPGEGRGDRDRAGEGRRRRFRGVDPQVLADARARFRKSLGTFLTPEQAEQAGKALRTFNTQWDTMVDIIAGFGLESDLTYAALSPIQAFMVEVVELRESGDWMMMREEMSAAREEMNDALGKVLTDEQFEEFQSKTTRRRGRGNRQRGSDGIPPEGL